jgi:two-component system, chemotaxis family, sensor kinase CheA
MDDSILDDFLVDSHEGLDRMDRDLLALERDPAASEPVASAFRSLHTIKGTCSFLGLRRLERVAHAGESLLAALRAGRLRWSREIADALLATADTVRAILAAIESGRSAGDPREPEGDDGELLARLAACGESAPARDTLSPGAPPTAVATGVAAESALQQQHLRVDVRRLDAVMDLVGELVLARNQLLRSLTGPGLAGPGRAGCPPGHEDDAAGEPASSRSSLGAAAQRLDQATTRLQDEIMRTRMQPVSAAWARLPRLVRDVASACGKRVRLETKGDGTELDRALVEALKDPLTHLVRNAIDHGIEDPAVRERAGKPAEGTLRLTAFEDGGSVRLELSDDGAGMPAERIREQAVARGLVDAARARQLGDEECLAFVFLPGFSTAKEVTSISGRGVGLDAARAAIEAVGGSLGVRTVAGSGTTFHVRLPLTLAILPALTLEESGETYAVPQAHVLELVRCAEGPSGARIEHAHDRPVFRLRGELLPVVELGRWLAAERADVAVDRSPRHLLVLAADGRRFGLAVERVRDTEDIVVKPLGHRLRESGVFAGATVLGDGRVSLILDAHALAVRAGLGPPPDAAAAGAPDGTGAAREDTARVPLLLVRARRGVRAAVRLEEIHRVVEFESTAFERLDEHPAVRLDGEVLAVAPFAGDPSLGAPGAFGESRTWPVLVHRERGRRVGLVVDAVVDIVDWDGGAVPRTDPADGAHGPRRIVIDDHVTDLVTLAGEAA